MSDVDSVEDPETDSADVEDPPSDVPPDDPDDSDEELMEDPSRLFCSSTRTSATETAPSTSIAPSSSAAELGSELISVVLLGLSVRAEEEIGSRVAAVAPSPELEVSGTMVAAA